MKMKLFALSILTVFASENENNAENDSKFGENPIVVKIEEGEYAKVNKSSKYIGVTYNKDTSKWQGQRHSKNEIKTVSNGCFDDEETAAHASDTLAKKLMENGERGHKLNFPDDDIEVYQKEKQTTSKFIGVSYHKEKLKWYVQRWNTYEIKQFYNGYYDDEEMAAHASDTLARKLMKCCKRNYKLNFPEDPTEVYPGKRKTSSKYIGASYNKEKSKWVARRRSKVENKMIYNGCYDDEEIAAHASDNLAKKLMKNGEQGHKLNFPDDDTELYPEENQKKRKRPQDLSLGHLKNN